MNNETTNSSNNDAAKSSNNNNRQNNNRNQQGGNRDNAGNAGNQNKNKKPYWKYKKKKSGHKPGVNADKNKNNPHKKNWNNKNKQFKSKINIPTHYLNELEKIARKENSTLTDVTLDAVKQYILEKDKENDISKSVNELKKSQKSPSLLKRLFGLK